MSKKLSQAEIEYLEDARVASLATSDLHGNVSLVPIVFANVEDQIYFVIDKKTKTPGRELRRLRNISENPHATLLVDRYSEDWEDLSYLMIFCTAKILESEKEKKVAANHLKKKFNQYREGGYFPDDLEKAVIVKLGPKRAVLWRNQRLSLA